MGSITIVSSLSNIFLPETFGKVLPETLEQMQKCKRYVLDHSGLPPYFKSTQDTQILHPLFTCSFNLTFYIVFLREITQRLLWRKDKRQPPWRKRKSDLHRGTNFTFDLTLYDLMVRCFCFIIHNVPFLSSLWVANEFVGRGLWSLTAILHVKTFSCFILSEQSYAAVLSLFNGKCNNTEGIWLHNTWILTCWK